MLAQETQEQLSKYGFDVSALTDAIKSEEEVKLDVPELYTEKGHTKDDLTVFGKNRFDEGKTAMSEIMAKSYKEKYGLDIDGKDLDNVVDAIKEKYSKPSDNKELETNFKDLQSKYSELESSLTQKEKEFENRLFQTTLRQSLSSVVPKEVLIAQDKAVNLYLMENSIENVDGQRVVKIDGEIQKDHLLNPVDVNTHFKSWLDESGLVTKKGMNGKNSDGSTSAKFSNASEFYTWCTKNGKDAMSDEMQKYYLENKS